ncbi:MAG: hypothetical protein CBB69_007655 [Phycisphaera sp. TMED9]|nr:MAG: hypothetical protein CBB69_007655 [Phycisphaera sp. TMED9]
MNLDPRQLLRRLEPAVRPVGVGAPVGTLRSSIDGAGFEELLERASNGEFTSGREIDESRLEEALEDRFSERLAGIADAAEAAGFEQVLVVAGDRPLLLAVSDRRIERELGAEAESEGVLLPVDAAVRLGGDGSEDRNIITGPSAVAVPAEIAEAILAAAHSENQPSIQRDDAA